MKTLNLMDKVELTFCACYGIYLFANLGYWLMR
jgi:hypothetical protein